MGKEVEAGGVTQERELEVWSAPLREGRCATKLGELRWHTRFLSKMVCDPPVRCEAKAGVLTVSSQMQGGKSRSLVQTLNISMLRVVCP